MAQIKHVSELITPPSPGSGEQTALRTHPEPSKQSGLSDKQLVDFWTRMTEMYGHKWISAYGEKVSDTWTRGLSDLTPSQIGKGLRECLNRDGWPPTLPEFRVMCLLKIENCAMYRVHSHLALPKPKPSYDKARPFLQTMKHALRGTTRKGEEPSSEGREKEE